MATNKLNLLSEDTFAEKMDNLILAIHGTSQYAGVTTWKEVQSLVRSGLASKYFSVGDRFIAEKETAITANSSNSSLSVSINELAFIEKEGEVGNKEYEFEFDGLEWKDGATAVQLSAYGITVSGSPQSCDKIAVHETASDIEFVVMGFDQETPVDSTRTHSMTLAMNYTFTGVQFDEREAFYANNTSNALPAGTYHFRLGAHSWYSADVGKDIQFTLSNALPVGGQLVFAQSHNATLVGAKVNVFASGSALTASESATMSEGSGGTSLGTLDNSLSNGACMNHCQRAIMGSNRWSHSAIRQWCNSDSAKSTYWKPQHSFDRAPSWNASLDGFLYKLDPSLSSVLGKCKKDVEIPTCDGGGHEKTDDKVWLLDRYEIQSCSSSEASSYPPYQYWHELLGDTYGDWRNNPPDPRFIKLNKKGGSAQYWWLRSPNVGYASIARIVYASGYVSSSGAYNGSQASVAFAII